MVEHNASYLFNRLLRCEGTVVLPVGQSVTAVAIHRVRNRRGRCSSEPPHCSRKFPQCVKTLTRRPVITAARGFSRCNP